MVLADPRYRPLPLRAVNGLGRPLRRHFDLELSRDALLAQARDRTRLDDFGPADFLEPLARLIAAYNEEADLNFVGLLAARTYLLRLLANRLRMERDRALYPQIAAQCVERPVIILGLPRTGSTLLHELLAQDPALRTPLSWEIMLPSPPPQQAAFERDPRIRRTQRMLDWVERIAPEFKRIHPLGARLPQECIAITAQAFRSIEFHTTHDVPSYQDWLEQADPHPAYRYHYRMLQQLQAFGPSGRWLLKAPGHLFAPRALLATYPDARFVQTHRDPLRVVTSIASHCTSLRQAFSEHIDPTHIGTEWSRRWSLALERTLAFRATHHQANERFLDLDYTELTAAPLRAVERVYSHLERPLTPQVRERMAAWLARHPQNRFGRHRYSPAQFGLDGERERERFAAYIETYGVKIESETA